MSAVICRTAISPVSFSSSPSASLTRCRSPTAASGSTCSPSKASARKRTKLEEYLDRGVGECHLRDPRIAKLCEEALLFFHHERYELLAWCVTPNHVHMLVHVWQTPLSKMVQSWKRHIAKEAEAYLAERRSPTRSVSADATNAPARRAALQTLRWQREYWDTFMRD